MSYADPSLTSACIEAGGLPIRNVPAGDRFKPHHIQRLSDGRWLYLVHSMRGQTLLSGTTYTKDGAFRAARNFIKNNQNAVYSPSECRGG
jgi:hypothetical protein